MKAQVLGLNWRNYKPQLTLRTEDGIKRNELEVGEELGFKATKVRKCIGYFHAGKYRKCPLDSKVENQKQCSYCRDLDPFWPCVVCKGEKCRANPRRRKKCLNTLHGVYLVSFGERIKVGVSGLRRLRKRWIEQGADFGILLSKHNGKEARKKEEKLSRRFEDKISFKGKVKQLGNWNKRVLKREIEANGLEPEGKVFSVLPNYLGLKGFKDFNGLKIRKSFGKGVVKAVKGPILIYKKEDSIFGYNLRDLAGRIIKI